MPLRESEAIVLRSYPLGEGDRLVSFLSRSLGRVRGVASGARRPKSRFGSTLEPLSYVRMWFYERETRELVRINQCELMESFLEAQKSYDCGVALAHISEITEAVLPEREVSDPTFRLLLMTCRAIQATSQPEMPLLYFNLWTVRLAGWLPELGRCTRCGKELTGESVFASLPRPGLNCANCRLPGTRRISLQSLGTATRMLSHRLDELAQEPWPKGRARDLNEYLLDVVEHQIERKLTARKMMETRE
jgi:DNA repair protein RecO (recombination protein O)